MMEINPFILALSKTLPESCLQGLAVYLLLQLYFLIGKRSTPLLKFNIYYIANLGLLVGFILTFFHHYQQIRIASFTPDFLPNKTGNPISVIIAKPNLWLQFNFWINHYAYLITGFYLLGLLFCILKLAIGLINISWFRNNRNLKLDNYLTQVSIQLSSNFRLIKTVSVFVSDKISVPLTLGFIKPIIVFPVALVNQLSPEQTEAILLHELAHIKRNDYLLNILLCIVQSFLFFNPAVWLMKREINKYREQCCDDLVIDNTSHKIAYAHALLLIEQNRSETLHLTLASNGKKYTLLNRIKRITNMKINEPSPQNKLVVLLLALITIGLTVAWNLPVKKVVKHYFTIDKFNVIKEARDTSHMRITSDKIVYTPKSQSSKKVTFTGKRMVFDSSADTTIKSKNKFKIVLQDSLGNKKEYNSIDELPADDQREFLKQNKKPTIFKDVSFSLKFPDSTKYTYHSKYIDSADLHRQAKEMALMAKKQIADYKKRVDSPEWKEQTRKLREEVNSPEAKKMIEKVRAEANSPEVKKLIEELRKTAESPEFKSQMGKLHSDVFQDHKLSDKMLKFYQSAEWKKQQKKITKEIEKAQKEWRKNYDEQRKLNLPEKTITPQY